MAPGLVLVPVDFSPHLVSLAIELTLVLLGQMSSICTHILFFFVLEMLFAALKIFSLLRRKRAVFQTFSDAFLLHLLAVINLIDAGVVRVVFAGSAACAEALSICLGRCGCWLRIGCGLGRRRAYCDKTPDCQD